MSTKAINVRNTVIGGGAPVTIQAMTNTDTADIESTIAQILELEDCGAEIVRFSVYNDKCAEAIKTIRKNTHVPLVADIHFDYRLAILSAENGIDKLRINPGNIGSEQRIKLVADCAKRHKIPIRIGVNSGSVEYDLLQKYGGATPEALAKSALRHARLLEKVGYDDIVISVKASDVSNTVEACKLIHTTSNYPQHIGVTESGMGDIALVKSAIGIGSLLLSGIGDTIRVSLTGAPKNDVVAAKLILRAIGMRPDYVEIISCPTCGRTTGNHEAFVQRIKSMFETIPVKRHIRIAVMGCVVNGVGEGKEADIGIAFAPGGAAVFKNGTIAYSGEREETIEKFIYDCGRMIDDAKA